ncbi:MAG: hypothetical protein LBM77_02090 [Spirochaetaceae bacterium]|jgi:hypothetical protein|nr:hypothetical protein [Spirochaetaceae bacterium]
MDKTYNKMPFDKWCSITGKVLEMEKEGKKAEAMAYFNANVPMLPFLAKIFKEKLGADVLRASGCNLSEAEAVFGSDWLDS